MSNLSSKIYPSGSRFTLYFAWSLDTNLHIICTTMKKNRKVNKELLPQKSLKNQHSMEVNVINMHDIAHLLKIAKPLCNWFDFKDELHFLSNFL